MRREAIRNYYAQLNTTHISIDRDYWKNNCVSCALSVMYDCWAKLAKWILSDMSMVAKNQAVNLPETPKRPWHASLFGHHTELTCWAELSQQRLQGLSCYYWHCVRDISASSLKGRWLPSLVMQPVLLKTSPPPPHPQLPPHHFPLSTLFQMTSLCGKSWLQKCSESEAWACWTNPSSGVQDYDLPRFLNDRCDDSVLACTCATPRCACISTHLSGGSATDEITLRVRTAGALIVFQRATCLH